jgi:hypothetical protein
MSVAPESLRLQFRRHHLVKIILVCRLSVRWWTRRLSSQPQAGRWVKARGKDFVETVRELAADANVQFPYENPPLKR